ncbi:MAG: hypothetical protein J1F01_05710 [Oscillospiraceae bacterium]|nr:hypothetical protein [Oscillospiraceae bacterium]
MGVYGYSKYGLSKYGRAIGFIFDRTEMDLINNTEKAYINASDLNRIENGMKAIAENYEFSLTTKTDWKQAYSNMPANEFPLKTHMERIIRNLNTIIDKCKYTPTVEVPTSFENMTIYKMNSIEYILDDITRQML